MKPTHSFDALLEATNAIGKRIEINSMIDGFASLVEDADGERYEIMIRPASLSKFYVCEHCNERGGHKDWCEVEVGKRLHKLGEHLKEIMNREFTPSIELDETETKKLAA